MHFWFLIISWLLLFYFSLSREPFQGPTKEFLRLLLRHLRQEPERTSTVQSSYEQQSSQRGRRIQETVWELTESYPWRKNKPVSTCKMLSAGHSWQVYIRIYMRSSKLSKRIENSLFRHIRKYLIKGCIASLAIQNKENQTSWNCWNGSIYSIVFK